jgi:hypothetical protein
MKGLVVVMPDMTEENLRYHLKKLNLFLREDKI